MVFVRITCTNTLIRFMRLKNKYVFGCLVQFYELEMLEEHIKSCVKMLEGVENKENVTFDFCFSMQEHYEKIDGEYVHGKFHGSNTGGYYGKLQHEFEHKTGVYGLYPAHIKYKFKTNNDPFYNIADYRRDLNDTYCNKVDMVCWSETDSLWPSQTLQLLEFLHEHVKDTTPKYIANFADRKLWDNSFAPCHPNFEVVEITDELNDEASGKAYMSYERMEEINNIPLEHVYVQQFDTPRFDGSCVCFSSELLKSGVNIPHSLLLAGEDTSIGIIAKKLLGDKFVQYNFSNILHVHNRRHPKKRMGVLDENNPKGFCDSRKGDWWPRLERKSKYNLNNLFNQVKFETNGG